jgi:inhibitor of KinA
MISKPEEFPHITPVGESAILVEFGERIERETNDRVYALDEVLEAENLVGNLDCVPGYTSLLINYDPLILDDAEISAWLTERLTSCQPAKAHAARRVEIPVRYGGEDGPDLAFVAEKHQLTSSEVVQLHTAAIYRVGMMGFTPGFAYLMGLDPRLATPRLVNPRTLVPAGSVGIAGSQTGVYPLESPGGWQLIGRTDLTLFDPEHDPHFLLAPGDEVRFVIAPGSTVL